MAGRGRVRRGAAVGAAAVLLVALLGTSGSSASAEPGIGSESGAAGQDRAGLVRDERCGRAFRIAVAAGVRCTHGADPAPAGVDTSRRPTTEELYAQATATAATTTTATNGPISCYGDGTTGKRVQAVYAHAADVADRYADLAPLILQWATATDAVFADSAAATGGTRHVRWVTDPSCNLVVQRVQVSTTGDDSMDNTIAELHAAGLNRTDRKYLVWMDSSRYCGIAELQIDDSAVATNANNYGPSVARVDSICWGKAQPVEAHELMHTLGGVQASAPHATAGYHCTDENDILCYQDGPGVTLTYTCPVAHERLFDCNHDDYFSTAPAPGSYLATHWNAASSGFIASVPPDGPGSGSDPAPSPASTSTVTFSGSLNRKSASVSYPLTTGAGTVQAEVRMGKRATVTVAVAAPDGTTLSSASGTSPVTTAATVAAGANRLVLSSGSSVSYTVTVTYPTP